MQLKQVQQSWTKKKINITIMYMQVGDEENETVLLSGYFIELLY